jgi:hypothetical protein
MAKEGSMITTHEEHAWQFASKKLAITLAKLESQRTGIKHTHYLTGTYRI